MKAEFEEIVLFFRHRMLAHNVGPEQSGTVFRLKNKISHAAVSDAALAVSGLAAFALMVAKGAAWFFTPSWGMALLIGLGIASPPSALVIAAGLGVVAVTFAGIAGLARFYSWVRGLRQE